MAISKRLRYEVLRRDNNTCRYCGDSAPDVKLTVDHVLPIALGGTDDPENLVAACQPCNAGKSSISPDAPLVADVAADVLRWTRAMSIAARRVDADRKKRNRYARQVVTQWEIWDADLRHLPADFDRMTNHWLGLQVPIAVVTEAVDIAWTKQNVPRYARWAYVIGIMKNRIREMETVARAIFDSDGAR